jgi:acetoin utilization deacetylase AcuC-like enzyme
MPRAISLDAHSEFSLLALDLHHTSKPMRRRLFYSDHHEIQLPQGHTFPMAKYRLLRQVLEDDGLYAMEPAPAALPEIIERIHDPAYVASVLSGTLPPRAIRRIGFLWSEALVARILCSVGGTLSATADAIEYGYGGVLAGGTHHAFRAEGSGLCVFNDIAVAAAWLMDERGLERLAVADCDVHQGDGTAQIFESDPRVFTLSLHGRKNFPFRKQRSRLDVELEDGTGDEEYLAALDEAMNTVLEFKPQALFFQSGVDALACDRLGRLALTHEGLRRRDWLVLSRCRQNGIPVTVTLGGGYGNPLEATVEAHANTYRAALEIFGNERQAVAVTTRNAPS